MPDDLKVGSPEWWLRRLDKQLSDRVKRLQTYQDYIDSKHRLAFASLEFRAAFGGLFADYADNFMPLIVNACNDRIHVEGFRFGTSEDVRDRAGQAERADKDAWGIWQRNEMDLYSHLAHRTALELENSAAIVWVDDENQPRITVESPFELVYERQPGGRRIAAALKSWRDDWTGQKFATLYLPDGIYKFQTRRAYAMVFTESRWDKRTVQGEDWPLENPLGYVPVIPFENDPDLRQGPRSEIALHIPVQDSINFFTIAMMCAAEVGGFRQRWATGMEIPKDPVTGQPIEAFEAAVRRIWVSTNPDSKFGDFEVTPLENYTKAIEAGVEHLATKSETPQHYFKGQVVSGESIKSAEAGLVAKSNRKMRVWEEAWERTMRTAFDVLDDPRAEAFDSETIWRDPEFRTEGEHVDALLKLQTLGVPNEVLWEKYGFTPQEIDRMLAMGADGGPAEEAPPAEDQAPADGAAATAAA